MMTTARVSKKYAQFIFLILSFFIPIMISWFVYYNHEHFNLKSTNHGVLINPPIDVKSLWQSNDSKKWQIVHVSKAICDADCEHVDYTLNQVKKALGKNSDRVDIKKISMDESSVAEHNQHLQKEGFAIENKVYLVDPAGNLFMYYADTSNPMDILKDVKHVLEVSKIG